MGVSMELWLVLCCFLFVWPVAPFAPFIFCMLNVAAVLIINAKVRPPQCVGRDLHVQRVRHACVAIVTMLQCV